MDQAELDRRFDHHPPPDQATVRAHETVRAGCRELAGTIAELLPPGRERRNAFDRLEEVMMWANAAIARNGGPVA